MSLLLQTLNTPGVMLTIGTGGAFVALVALVVAIVALSKTRRARRRYEQLVQGESGQDLESILVKNHQLVNQFQVQLKNLQERVENHEERVRNKAVRPSVVRYNAFGETGNDLSFSLALLDEKGNGAVLSGIFGREESRVYAKPVAEGESTYTMTDEEREAIRSKTERE